MATLHEVAFSSSHLQQEVTTWNYFSAKVLRPFFFFKYAFLYSYSQLSQQIMFWSENSSWPGLKSGDSVRASTLSYKVKKNRIINRHMATMITTAKGCQLGIRIWQQQI